MLLRFRPHLLRKGLSGVVIAALIMQPALTALPAYAASPQLTRNDYDACRSQDESALRAAVAAISKAELQRALTTMDYPARVGVHWRELGLSDIIDKRVDMAISDVRNETSWGDLLRSLGNTEQAQKLATEVAERVYQSQPVSNGIEQLATAVSADVGRTIELASADAETSLLDCLKAFVGPRYGDAMARAMAGDAHHSMAVDPNRGAGQVSSGAVLKEASGGLAGATILIVRRQLATIGARVGQRIAGSVLSRLVSVVAGGIGLVLIAKDIWELRNGVLPIISSEMKAESTKVKVRDEIATSISTQISSHVDDLSNAAADQVMLVWQEFKRAHALVLKISDQDGAFRSFLDGLGADQLPRLDEVVGIIAADGGDGAVLADLANGKLNTAVSTMPDAGMQIARETRSVDQALGWTSIAPDRLDAILRYEIHKRATPEDFTRATLERVLALDDRTAIMRVAAVPRQAREALLALDANELTTLARRLSDSELTTLAGYLNGLGAASRDKVLRTIAADPAKMSLIASTRVRDAMIASADQLAAAELMLRSKAGMSPAQAFEDLKLAWSGQVSALLIWEKHPAVVVLALILGLFSLLWLRRLFRPRPPAAPPAPPTPGPDVNTPTT